MDAKTNARDVTERQGAIVVGPSPQAFLVRVVEGPDRQAERRIDRSTEQAVLVGQSPVCELRVSDPAVSRRHASLDLVGARLRVRDLGSKNGTRVSGVLIGEAFLEGGERVLVGATVLEVHAIKEVASDAPAAPRSAFGRLLGKSSRMRRLYPLLDRLATSNVSVLIEGETGTGKEVVARALHDEGPRRDRPFVVFDCSAVAPAFLESELFGHERGAFTGAIAMRRGVFEQAHTGTLFLDELGELPLDLQSRLLRVLERSEVRRLGSNEWVRCDVRFVAATRRDIDREVQDGRFRDDLFHRIAVARVELPALRDRAEDVGELVSAFCRELGEVDVPIPQRLVDEWRRRPWPGNVRELRNAVHRHLALGESVTEPDQGPEDLSSDSDAPRAPLGGEMDAVLALGLTFPEARDRVLYLFQRRYVEGAVTAAGGNMQLAAQIAGIAPRYFRALRARLGG